LAIGRSERLSLEIIERGLSLNRVRPACRLMGDHVFIGERLTEP